MNGPKKALLPHAFASDADAQREAGRRSPCALQRAAVVVAVIVGINRAAPANKIEREAVLSPSITATRSASIAVVVIAICHAGSLRKCFCTFRARLLQGFQAEPLLFRS
jgi:hypothetical protein